MEITLKSVVMGALAIASLPAANLSTGDSTGPRAVWVVKADAHTGKLKRALMVAPGSNAETQPEVQGLIAEAAKNFDVNPLLVDSVIQVESNYNPFAVSAKGAQGLMQLMPGTAQRFGVTDSFDPKQNIEGGVRYLKFLQDTFGDDRLAIAAYNAGENAVARYKDVPPYPETVSYVAKVGKKYGQAKRTAGNRAEAREQAKMVSEPEQANDAPRHILGYVDPEGKLHIATQ